jgi:hypothetical protein
MLETVMQAEVVVVVFVLPENLGQRHPRPRQPQQEEVGEVEEVDV